MRVQSGNGAAFALGISLLQGIEDVAQCVVSISSPLEAACTARTFPNAGRGGPVRAQTPPASACGPAPPAKACALTEANLVIIDAIPFTT
jgi:hypothetical protein